MSEWKKPTISASEIINLINPNHPIGDSEAARIGKLEHNRVSKNILERNIPDCLKQVRFDMPVTTPTKPSLMEIANGLWLSVRPDIKTPRQVCELKPGAKELRYYALQLAIGCMVEDVTTGILFFYKSDLVFLLNHGGRSTWSNIREMGIQARRIYDIQEEMDRLKKIPTKHNLYGRNSIAFEIKADWSDGVFAEKQRLGYESVETRKRFDINTNIVFTALKSDLGYLK